MQKGAQPSYFQEPHVTCQPQFGPPSIGVDNRWLPIGWVPSLTAFLVGRSKTPEQGGEAGAKLALWPVLHLIVMRIQDPQVLLLLWGGSFCDQNQGNWRGQVGILSQSKAVLMVVCVVFQLPKQKMLWLLEGNYWLVGSPGTAAVFSNWMYCEVSCFCTCLAVKYSLECFKLLWELPVVV